MVKTHQGNFRESVRVPCNLRWKTRTGTQNRLDVFWVQLPVFSPIWCSFEWRVHEFGSLSFSHHAAPTPAHVAPSVLQGSPFLCSKQGWKSACRRRHCQNRYNATKTSILSALFCFKAIPLCLSASTQKQRSCFCALWKSRLKDEIESTRTLRTGSRNFQGA